MKRVKRKYTRKPTPDAPECEPTPVKEESSAIPRVDTGTGEIIVGKAIDFSFDMLPRSLRVGVERTIKMRERLKLPDDSIERKERAIKMFRGDKPR